MRLLEKAIYYKESVALTGLNLVFMRSDLHFQLALIAFPAADILMTSIVHHMINTASPFVKTVKTITLF